MRGILHNLPARGFPKKRTCNLINLIWDKLLYSHDMDLVLRCLNTSEGVLLPHLFFLYVMNALMQYLSIGTIPNDNLKIKYSDWLVLNLQFHRNIKTDVAIGQMLLLQKLLFDFH